MGYIDTVVIGGGQAGLATSKCLTDQGVDHVVLERGRVAESWLSERWDSLTLLTPNWQTRLPGYRYRGGDPDGYMSPTALASYLTDYCRAVAAPVETETSVETVVRRKNGRYLVVTNRGVWNARTVVIAAGACGTPSVPEFARDLPGSVQQLVPADYRNPDQLQPGGVLVVGAGATGVQLADELAESGRPVVLSAGGHSRVPRRYRGQDIMAWLDLLGVLTQKLDPNGNVEAVRSAPSFQLRGRVGAGVDLAALAQRGVRLMGSVLDIAGNAVTSDRNLASELAKADARQTRLLKRIDDYVNHSGFDHVPEQAHPEPVSSDAIMGDLDLGADGVRSVIWATGYRIHFPWLDVSGVWDAPGQLAHRLGVLQVPGLYCLGLPFVSRRNSTFIDGVGADARHIAEHIKQHLEDTARSAA